MADYRAFTLVSRGTTVIACLQELKAWQEKFPAPALRQAAHGAIWHGRKSENGIAILARLIRLKTASGGSRYARLMQEDGYLAWSNPIHVSAEAGAQIGDPSQPISGSAIQITRIRFSICTAVTS
jgi:hypothetical protein